MPLVDAWQCPKTGKLWPANQRDKYRAHLHKLAAQRFYERKINKLKTEAETYLANTLWCLPTVEDVAHWLRNHGEWLVMWFESQYGDSTKKRLPKLSFSEISFNVTYRNCVSNSHSAPRGEPTNWMAHKTLPLGYPGFLGRVEFSLKDDPYPYRVSDIFEQLLIHTGTGGGGKNNYGYDVRLFAADWPGLATYYHLSQG